MDLAELIRDIEGLRLVGAAGVRVDDITEDSRTVLPGSLFVARRGLRSDGRAFIEQAVRDGAAAVLTDEEAAPRAAGLGCGVVVAQDPALATAQVAERFYRSPGQALRLAGITGTNGKTTVAHLAHQMLNQTGERTGLIGTVEIDDGVEVAPSDMTTMPAPELSRTLAVMREAGCSGAVMEVSSHALAQKRVAALAFEVGVFTNLTRDHLDYHGTMEAYARAKSELFASLDAGATAVVNADDPWCRTMLEGCRAEAVRCTTGGDGRGVADCSVRRVDTPARTPAGAGHAGVIESTRYELAGPWGSFEVAVPLLGAHNGMNLLQAACVCWSLGVDAESLRVAAAGVSPPTGRMEFVSPPGAAVAVVVDFAHTPDALEKALLALRPIARGDLWVVFGAGGAKDRDKRPMMGGVVARLADRTVITSDNPRAEDPSAIVGDIVRGVPDDRRGAMRVHVDRAVAIERAIAGAKPGDVVLIAGRGHERRQVIGDGHGGTTEIDFVDADVARRAILAAGSVSP
ncbi:MAG: UDP-N-acetylmuramoyl-L-alanyl-D-glutamate--2,6-diaminopimelate ligase [Planctomycetota bacterium]